MASSLFFWPHPPLDLPVAVNVHSMRWITPRSNFGRNPHYSTVGYKSFHPGGAMFCMGDDSVHFFSETIDFNLFNGLGTKAGGEVAPLP